VSRSDSYQGHLACLGIGWPSAIWLLTLYSPMAFAVLSPTRLWLSVAPFRGAYYSGNTALNKFNINYN